MKKVQSIVLISIVTTLITRYNGVNCNGAAAASASATAAASAAPASAPDVGTRDIPNQSWDETYREYPYENPNWNGAVDFTREDKIALLRAGITQEVTAHPELYDAQDIDAFMTDDNIPVSFLNQRSNDWQRAYKLAVKTLRWRASMGLSQLAPSHFPCDLFRLGLIFEHGLSHERAPSGEYVLGNRVIWIRLGAIGSVIKHLERFTPKRMLSFTLNTAKSGTSMLSPRKSRSNRNKKPLVQDLSMRNERTVMHVFRSIAWWLENWRITHPPGTRATLVLDFENTDFALASKSAGEFFLGLDEYYPDLFDQIIGFRFKLKIFSIHSPITLANKLFKSRLASSPETDRKLKFVKTEPKISAYIPRVDVNGFSMLPEHVSGYCVSPSRLPPAGCVERTQMVGYDELFDPQLWQAIHNEFYQLCKPRDRSETSAI